MSPLIRGPGDKGAPYALVLKKILYRFKAETKWKAMPF